jgi:hypothetical protein
LTIYVIILKAVKAIHTLRRRSSCTMIGAAFDDNSGGQNKIKIKRRKKHGCN